MGSSEMKDYLTCGSCLREFPLQKITVFIQHKKLDCDDNSNDAFLDSPELQCNYCPRGFMTAWALLIHAQLNHNMKIFLETASKSFLKHVQFAQISPAVKSDKRASPQGSHQYEQDQNLLAPVTEVDEPLSSFVNKTLSSKTYNSVDSNTLTSSSNIVERSCVTKDSFVGNRNILDEHTKPAGAFTKVSGYGIGSGKETADGLPEQQLNSIQIHQRIIAVPCKQSEVISTLHKSLDNVLDPKRNVASLCRSQTLPSICLPRVMKDPYSGLYTSPDKCIGIVKDDMKKLQHNHVKTQEKIGTLTQETDNSLASESLIGNSMDIEVGNLRELVKEADEESNSGINLDKQDRSVDTIKFTKMTDSSDNVSDTGDIFALGNQSANPLKITSDTSKSMEVQENAEDQEDGTDTENNRVEPCCSDQGCGVTVIPGSHQTLQKCCNAVLPKKRKRHFETKHMPFSWSSSRYAKRRMLQNSRDRQYSSVGGAKGGSTIYIDVEPGSFIPKFEMSASTAESTTNVTTSQLSSTRSSKDRIVTSQSKPRSLILRPGAVFSIPLKYTIPSSAESVFKSASVPQLSSSVNSSVSSGSLNGQNNTDSSTRTISQEADILQPSYKVDSVESRGTDEEDVKPDVNEEQSRKKCPTSREFKCEICDITFKQRIHLKKHMCKHTGVKPYKCGQCDYSTVERSHLKVHIRIHTGEKPFKCTYCEYATAQNSTLKIHLKRHHGGLLYQCPNCEKNFTQQDQLIHHKWEHSPTDKPATQANRHSPARNVMNTEVSKEQKSVLGTPVTSTSHTVPHSDHSTITGITVSNSPTSISPVSASSRRDTDHVIPATNRNPELGHVIATSNGGLEGGQVISIPSVSLTDKEAAELLNSLTVKLLEEVKQHSQSNKDSV